ncbi:MAG TPA: F0F1 ATP synthase subunit B [Bacteroidales bacterium]|nr:F0F1 ATP synthase subunit B [Bacteroidales bacterium]
MDLLTPGIGMIFWSTLFFLILLFILGKFAWPSIRGAINARNESIRNALEEADKARKEMAKLTADNEKVLAEAKTERDNIIKEARDIKEKLINEAREKGSEESAKMIKHARETIQSEKEKAIADIKNQMAVLSIDIAEKVLRSKLSNQKEQVELARKLADDMELN